MSDPNDDPVLGDAGYPSDAEIDRIANWSDALQTPEKLEQFLAYFRARWKYGDNDGWIGWRRDGRKLGISTGGWSGNETLIDALQGSIVNLFWMCCWQESHRGGHYVFELPEPSFWTTTPRADRKGASDG